ncbi:hypothetical protein DY000_02030224 [Brassica cretica]|uniref:Uncharacterized protein n=1 Tax=Brassica cretica TaxID=69181 RepID=A0ABQ7DEI5_BRACR|nr:hypothetical protein DY000_02030224 [Brassica cretica]
MSRSARYRAWYISGGTIRACSKAHYQSESVMFHWLLDFNFLGIVLVDLLEESSSATELLRCKICVCLVMADMCFIQFVSAPLRFRELDSSRDFRVVFGWSN